MDNQTDKLIAIRIDSALSSCFGLVSKLMHMKTSSSETDEGRNQLLKDLNEILDNQRTLLLDLKELNILV